MDLSQFIITAGYLGLFGVIFAESGLLFGIVFPGDSLLFTAGFLASQGIFKIVPLALMCFVAAVTGDSVGYTFGRRVGKRFFTRERSFFFRPENVSKAQEFYAKYGGKTIILARFIPGVRTIAPILAGVGDMRYGTFLKYNLMGGFVWAVGVTALGYYLGRAIPGADKYLLPIIGFIIIASFLPTAWRLAIDREHRHRVKRQVVETWRNRKQG
jgi:membrane-associated protein